MGVGTAVCYPNSLLLKSGCQGSSVFHRFLLELAELFGPGELKGSAEGCHLVYVGAALGTASLVLSLLTRLVSKLL